MYTYICVHTHSVLKTAIQMKNIEFLARHGINYRKNNYFSHSIIFLLIKCQLQLCVRETLTVN